MEYYSAMKKAIMPSAPTRMYPVIITPNEVSQRKTNTVWYHLYEGFPGGSVIKNLPATVGDVGREDPLKKDMATHSSILAWEIAWTRKPSRL